MEDINKDIGKLEEKTENTEGKIEEVKEDIEKVEEEIEEIKQVHQWRNEEINSLYIRLKEIEGRIGVLEIAEVEEVEELEEVEEVEDATIIEEVKEDIVKDSVPKNRTIFGII